MQAEFGGKRGYVPCNFLEEVQPDQLQEKGGGGQEGEQEGVGTDEESTRQSEHITDKVSSACISHQWQTNFCLSSNSPKPCMCISNLLLTGEGVRGEGRADCLTLDVSEEDCVSVVLCNTQL